MKRLLALIMVLSMILGTLQPVLAEEVMVLPNEMILEETTEQPQEVVELTTEITEEAAEEPELKPDAEPVTENDEGAVAEPTAEPEETAAVDSASETAQESVAEPAAEAEEAVFVESTAEPVEETVTESTTETAETVDVEPTAEPEEETVAESTTETAETVDVEPTAEPEEETVVEPTADPEAEVVVEPAIEPIVETIVEEELFRCNQSYAYVAGGVTVYCDRKLEKEMGCFLEKALVYVAAREETENEAYDVLTIRFAADGAEMKGYLYAKNVKFITYDEALMVLSASNNCEVNGVWLTETSFEKMIGAAAEPTAEPTAEPVEETVAEPTAEPVEEMVAEPTAESVEETVAEPTAEPVEETVAEPTAEPVEEAVAEPTAEPAEETVAEPTAEPAEETVAEPTAEPVEEAVTEPNAEPVEEAVAEPTAEPVEEAVAEPTAEQTAEPTVELLIEGAEEPEAAIARAKLNISQPNIVIDASGTWGVASVQAFGGTGYYYYYFYVYDQNYNLIYSVDMTTSPQITFSVPWAGSFSVFAAVSDTQSWVEGWSYPTPYTSINSLSASQPQVEVYGDSQIGVYVPAWGGNGNYTYTVCLVDSNGGYADTYYGYEPWIVMSVPKDGAYYVWAHVTDGVNSVETWTDWQWILVQQIGFGQISLTPDGNSLYANVKGVGGGRQSDDLQHYYYSMRLYDENYNLLAYSPEYMTSGNYYFGITPQSGKKYMLYCFMSDGISQYTEGWDVYQAASTVPSKPTGVTATAQDSSSIKVSWTKVTGATGYYVYRAKSSGGTYSKVGTITSCTEVEYTDTGLSANTKYYYKVTAYNAAGQSDKSSYAYDTTPPPPTPISLSTPTGVKATAQSSSSIKVTWSKVTGATGYYVYRSMTSSGTYVKVGTITAGTTVSYTDSSLSPDTKYYYKVQAFADIDENRITSEMSSYKSAITDEEDIEEAYLEVNHAINGDLIAAGSMVLTNSGNQKANWTINSNSYWNITTSGDSSWFTLSTTSGHGSGTNLRITTSSWTTTYREATLTFAVEDDYTGGYKYYSVKIYQMADGYDPDAK